MLRRYTPTLLLAAFAAVLPFAAAQGQETQTPDPDLPTTSEVIQVTATRVPEDVLPVPSGVSVISGEELEARGATDLPSALALIGGVTAASGGDPGPAGSVPELWGLREADAFLLVVDGVPWGGAFNPDLPALSLVGVERIEVLRGAAPVLYGATSFVGVIQVIHRAPGAGEREVRLSAGSFGSGSAAVGLALPQLGSYRQSLFLDATKQGFKDDRTEYQRAHLLYRGEKHAGRGVFRVDADLSALAQDPASPHPREGRSLSSRVPLDANHNPADARIDEDRFHLSGSYERELREKGIWSTTLALTHSKFDVLRGFLNEDLDETRNAHGYAQGRTVRDLYFDSHVAFDLAESWTLVAGVDHLAGRGKAESDLFAYAVALDGGATPPLGSVLPLERAELEDERAFSGLYLQAEWSPTERFRFQAGVRLNRTDEKREGEAEPALGEEEEGGDERVDDKRDTSRASGVLGLSFRAWSRGADAVWVFADYRDSFKPAAIDFGPEVEGGILKPETARSYEAGVRGRAADRFSWQLTAFQMDFENLVLAQDVGGFPALINAGSQRFQGIEIETEVRLRPDLRWRLAASLHDPKFRDFEQLFDGVPTQLRGHRLEMSAREMASTGFVYSPRHGWFGSAWVEYEGERFLNKRNTAVASSYTAWSAGVGYRFAKLEVRLDGRNLGDTRPPVAESELGDAQYYLLPARRIDLTLRRSF